MSCMCLSVVTMGYSRDPLDVCFRLDSPVETLGHSLKYFVLVELMNLRSYDAYHIIIPTDT